ncbi:MAG: glycine cleavage system aminomethyltransferase GcvT [Acidobacteria bacterium]|nr:glycine cleavage system aminomethyltransferase GcvT [Acidobacteriota bacterium]
MKQTPLNPIHRRTGARMVDFAGWDMPVQYESAVKEHLAVRTAAGLFDVSHMGEIEIRGPDALSLLQELTCNDVAALQIGQVQYSALMHPRGTFVDDTTVYRRGVDHYFLCVNASNQEKDFAWIWEHAQGRVTVENSSDCYAQLAVQGPEALSILQPLSSVPLEDIRRYWFIEGKFVDVACIISRTGYTGEDGFELYFPPEFAEKIWTAVLEAGKPRGLLPSGLAARNTLRLEAKMALYGNDIDETTTVLEADLGWIVKWHKGSFIGRDVLERQKREGVPRKLVGFEMVDRGIARDHHPVYLNDKPAGQVCSGSYAPFLEKSIGLLYLPWEHCTLGNEFSVDVRGKKLKARVVATPFYKRPK